MATDRDSRIDGICYAALALDGPSRDAFVAAACAGDEGLRREIHSLLRTSRRLTGSWRSRRSRWPHSVSHQPETR